MTGRCEATASGAEEATHAWARAGHRVELCDHHSRQHAAALAASGYKEEVLV